MKIKFSISVSYYPLVIIIIDNYIPMENFSNKIFFI